MKTCIPAWRHRWIMVRETARAWLSAPGGRKILFSPWPEVEQAVRRALQYTPYRVEFGPIPNGGGAYDLVVPLRIEDIVAGGRDAVLCGKNPLPIPSEASVRLCDDKRELTAFLRERGWHAYVPGERQAGQFPYILKKRQDANSLNCYRIDDVDAEHLHAGKVHSPEYETQEFILGEKEYALHLLVVGGRIVKSITIEYEMASAASVRGKDRLVAQARVADRHVGVFTEIVAALGFEGICCVNYKERGGQPVVLEINPRMGFSLRSHVLEFINVLF